MSGRLAVIAVPFIVGFGSLSALLAARGVSFRLFSTWAAGSEGRLRKYRAVRGALGGPSVFWCVAAGLYLGTAVSDIPGRYIFYVTSAIHVLLVLSVTIGVASMTGAVFTAEVQRLNMPIPTTALAGAVLKGAVIAVGVIITLGIVGISIAPLVTALGVGGLAVALAVQDTLANLFAGFHLLVDKSIRVGDFVRLESGHEGYVDDITWRTTRVRTLSNNTVMIPNKKLAQSEVVNYSQPETRMGISVALRIAYGADCDRVEAILMEEAKRAVGELPGLVAGQEPSVGFDPAESWIDCSLSLSVRQFTDQFGVRNELKKRILRRLAGEGIEVPFPSKTIYVKEA